MPKTQLLALARRLHGPKVELREHPKALTGPERAALAEKRKAAVARRKEIEPQLVPLPWKALTTAARFALDVDGDEPSWAQLRAAVERAEQFQSLRDESAELYTMLRATDGKMIFCRYEVVENLVLGTRTLAGGDSWAECGAKLGQAATAPAP